MSHSTIQYVKPPAKIWTPGSAGMLATARAPLTAGKPLTAGPPATAGPATAGPSTTACLKGTAETPTTSWLHQERQQ